MHKSGSSIKEDDVRIPDRSEKEEIKNRAVTLPIRKFALIRYIYI
jgi:hypothetical protein